MEIPRWHNRKNAIFYLVGLLSTLLHNNLMRHCFEQQKAVMADRVAVIKFEAISVIGVVTEELSVSDISIDMAMDIFIVTNGSTFHAFFVSGGETFRLSAAFHI